MTSLLSISVEGIENALVVGIYLRKEDQPCEWCLVFFSIPFLSVFCFHFRGLFCFCLSSSSSVNYFYLKKPTKTVSSLCSSQQLLIHTCVTHLFLPPPQPKFLLLVAATVVAPLSGHLFLFPSEKVGTEEEKRKQSWKDWCCRK